MAKLILNPTSSSRREIRLQRALLSIGRDPSNDLVLPDAMVSRRHAVIEYRANQYFLRDCSSSNGSVVNGDRVSERGLRDGDLLAIGTARLLFREEAEIEDPAAKVVPHPSVPWMQCPSCQADYRRGDLFCRECGAQVAVPSGPPKAVCASCGTAVLLPARFCSACGAALNPEGERLEGTKPHASPEAAEPAPATPPAPREAVAAPASAPDAAAEGEQKTTPPPSRAEALERGPAAVVVEPIARSSGAGAAAAPAMAFPHPRRLEKPAEQTVPPPGIQPDRTPAPPAAFASRLLAGVIDTGAVLIGEAALLAPLAYYWWGRPTAAEPADVPFLPILLTVGVVPLAAFLGVGYYAYFWGQRGASPGQRLLELAVETDTGVAPIGVPRALLRLFGYALSVATLGVGFVMIARDGLGLHDRIAGTRVVRRRGA